MTPFSHTGIHQRARYLGFILLILLRTIRFFLLLQFLLKLLRHFVGGVYLSREISLHSSAKVTATQCANRSDANVEATRFRIA